LGALCTLLLAEAATADSSPSLPPAPQVAPDPAHLRVCADPNNLPFSNAKGEGFENHIAALLAHDFHEPLAYYWLPQRRGFVRNTLQAGNCDVMFGVPADYELASPTRPYYRSSYVFVTRADRHLDLHSFDDPRLRNLRIGVHLIGADYSNTPPAQALADRGIVSNVRGYSIYGDYSQPDPPRTLIDAVAADQIDVAIAWGPQAGYFARTEKVPLMITAVADHAAQLPMQFSIAAGVRRGDADFKRRLDTALARHHTEIRDILVAYGVPLIEPAAQEHSP
jgi:quinoprotein dehydrogenase-associated probable ABC transporter substrate-binding protein